MGVVTVSRIECFHLERERDGERAKLLGTEGVGELTPRRRQSSGQRRGPTLQAPWKSCERPPPPKSPFFPILLRIILTVISLHLRHLSPSTIIFISNYLIASIHFFSMLTCSK